MSEIPLPALDELRDLAADASAATGIELTVIGAYRLIDSETRQVDGYSVGYNRPGEELLGWYAPLDRYAASAVITAFQISLELAVA